MTNPSFSQIFDARGPIHSGGGDLNNTTNNYYNTGPIGMAVRSPRANAIEDLEQLWRHFIHPPGFGQARALLKAHRIVLLDGASGSGRIAAAKVLLYEFSLGGERFHELLWEEDDGKRRLDPDHIGDDDRVWLDLSGVEEGVWREIQDELSAVRDALIKHTAYLVVVPPNSKTEGFRPGFGHHRAKIGRPPAVEVLRRHLRLAGVSGAVTSPMTPLLAAYLDTDPPIQEIATFAEFIVEARASAGGESDFSAWYAIAHEALIGRGQEVAEDVAKLSEGPQRALLLATAMLHGAHADHVYRAATVLLSIVGYPEDDCPLLERSDLIQKFRNIKIEIDGDCRAWFKQLGYDSAVRAHFWNHMPELRDGIRTWVEETANSPDLWQEDRKKLVDRFAEQCLLHRRYRQTLVDSVFRWTKGPMSNRRLLAADLALRHGLTAEEHGRFFRKQIYNWSRDKELPEGLAQVIIVMCADVIAVRHPDQAMVRLHHRARRESRSTSAREALVQLVNDDLRLRRQMLARLTRVSASGREWEADVGLFLEFTDPVALTDRGSRNHPLMAETDVRGMLADGWRRVFTQLTEAVWRERLRQWLFVALGDERHRDVLLDTLVKGSDGRGNVLGYLYTAAHNLPQPTTDERKRHAAFLGLVLRKICAAQGVQIT